jgi:hypothetical protein
MLCFGSRSQWLGGLALIATWGEQGRGLGGVLRCGLVALSCSGTSRRGYNYSGKRWRGREGSRGDSGWEWRGTTWFRARWRRQRAARQQFCFVTQGRRKVRRKRESRGWLGQMCWAMKKKWTRPVEGRWAAQARLFLVFYFIY